MPELTYMVDMLIQTSKYTDLLQSIPRMCHTFDVNVDPGRFAACLQTASIVVDLTTGTDSRGLASVCAASNVVYINASIENRGSKGSSLSAAHADIRQTRVRGPTCLLEHGINPGLVSHIAKYMVATRRLHPDELDTIHITEYDTHDHTIDDDTTSFYNGWSPRGLHDEATDRAEWSVGETAHPNTIPYDRVGPSAVAVNHTGRQSCC
jgi:homospermidine synthase